MVVSAAPRNGLKVGSLCSGVGGFDLGFHRAGYEPAWFCEFEPWRRKILARHFPGVPIHDDISTIDPDELEPVDVLIGGTPCQDLSVAGRRRGLAGARSGLFDHFVRVRDALDVPVTVWENVPGVFSSNGGLDFACVLEAFVGAGPTVPGDGWAGAGVATGPYGAATWRTLDSRFFGVPQRRRRVFVAASLGSGLSSEILLEFPGGRWDIEAGRAEGQGAAAAARGGAAGAGRAAPAGARGAGGDGARAAAGGGRGDGGRGDAGDGRVAATLSSARNHRSRPGRRQEDDVNLVADTLRSNGGDGGRYDKHPLAVLSEGEDEVANALTRHDAGAHVGQDDDGSKLVVDGRPARQTSTSGDTANALTRNYGKQPDSSDRDGGPPNLVVGEARATVDEAGALQASAKGYRNDADSAAAGHYAVTEASGRDHAPAVTARGSKGVDSDATDALALGQDLAGSLGRMGESGGHRLDLDGHGAYVATREDPTALDTRMGNGPDDNRAQAGHLVVREGADEVAKPLTAHKSGRRDDPGVEDFVVGSAVYDSANAMAGTDGGTAPTLKSGGSRGPGGTHPEGGPGLAGDSVPLVAGGEPSAFNWQSGGDVRHDVREGETGTLHKGQTPAVFGMSNGEAREHDDAAPTLAGGNAAPDGRHAGRSATQFTGVYTKRHNAEDDESPETWEESDTARTLNAMDGDRTSLAAARQLVRRLTPTECERLQGFPDGWTHPYGESLAGAPSWYEVPVPGSPGWASFNALPDQPERERGTKGAVELRETDRSLTLDTAGRDPSAHNGGMMLVKSVHEQGDGEGKVGDVYEKDEVDALASGGGKPGQGYPLVRVEGATAFKTDGDERSSVSAGDTAPTLRAAEAGTAAVMADGSEVAQPLRSNPYNNSDPGMEAGMLVQQPREEAGTVRSHMRPGSNADDVVLAEDSSHLDAIGGEVEATVTAFRPTAGTHSVEASEDHAPALKVGSGVGIPSPPAVAFTQNQREEVRELGEAGSLSGPGTHQTTYVSHETGALTSGEGSGTNRNYGGSAGRALDVAHALTAEGHDASEDGTGRGTPLVAGDRAVPAAVAAGVAAPFDPLPDGPRYASLGDAVTVPVAQFLGERVAAVLERHRAEAA